jgi:2-polyprenyl-3-methyl-5-hydroxy-6-metoxy-1,4-benzoquinol methylase
VSICRDCGLGFADPQPDDAELAAIYSHNYYAPFGYDPVGQDRYRRMKQGWFARLLALAESHSAPGKLLDVGSGLGDLLVVGRLRGWTVHAVEPNSFARIQAEGVAPGTRIATSVSEFEGAGELFNLVTCCDVLEHVRDPLDELRQMHRRLVPGGILLITTIDADGWQARLSGERWIHYLREHLWYFNRQTLTRLVEVAGFEVVHWEVPRKIFNLRYVFGIFAHHSQKRFWRGAWNAALQATPKFAQSLLLPGMPEGQLLIAKKSAGRIADSYEQPAMARWDALATNWSRR